MINKEPLVSIIMGVYNVRKRRDLLMDSVRSILNQTYLHWEFIICDDGSTDGSLEILNEIAQLDSRIKIIGYPENHGLAYALNACIQYCSGEYIARQDDDDVSYSDRLRIELELLEERQDYAFIGSVADIYDRTGIWGSYRLKENITRADFLWNSPFLHPSVMFRKTVLEAVRGYRVAKETRRCEDYDLFMRLYAAGFLGINIQEPLYKYYIERAPRKLHRPMKYRIDEAKVRRKGFRQLKIGIRRVPYIIKPLLLGLIPSFVFKKINQKKFNNRNDC